MNEYHDMQPLTAEQLGCIDTDVVDAHKAAHEDLGAESSQSRPESESTGQEAVTKSANLALGYRVDMDHGSEKNISNEDEKFIISRKVRLYACVQQPKKLHPKFDR